MRVVACKYCPSRRQFVQSGRTDPVLGFEDLFGKTHVRETDVVGHNKDYIRFLIFCADHGTHEKENERGNNFSHQSKNLYSLIMELNQKHQKQVKP